MLDMAQMVTKVAQFCQIQSFALKEPLDVVILVLTSEAHNYQESHKCSHTMFGSI